jgi:nucleotidyltransferase substrate binding protein (TIGR01987 family)
MTEHDIRWQQRFHNFELAFVQLQSACELAQQRALSALEQQGLVQAFEYTHELAWNTLKDFFEYQGIAGLVGSRDATREAFKQGLLVDGESWMEMISSRNLTSHAYNSEVVNEIVSKIRERYYPLFRQFQQDFAQRRSAKSSSATNN